MKVVIVISLFIYKYISGFLDKQQRQQEQLSVELALSSTIAVCKYMLSEDQKLKALIEIHALSDLFIGNCKLFDSFHYNIMTRGISDLTKCNYTIIRIPHKTYHGRFRLNKNSALKFRKFHVPNGMVHSDCTDPTQATARLVLLLQAGCKRGVLGTTILSN